MSKEYQNRRAIRLNRKTAKSKLKSKAARIFKQQKRHQENLDRAVIRRLMRKAREERGK